MKRLLFFTIFVAILATIPVYQQAEKVKALNEKTEQLAEQASALSMELETYKTLPDWLVDAYVKCNVEQVPKKFIKECVCYEIRGY